MQFGSTTTPNAATSSRWSTLSDRRSRVPTVSGGTGTSHGSSGAQATQTCKPPGRARDSWLQALRSGFVAELCERERSKHALNTGCAAGHYGVGGRRMLKHRDEVEPRRLQRSCTHPRPRHQSRRRRAVRRHALRRVPARQRARSRTRRRRRAGFHGLHRCRTQSLSGQRPSRRGRPRCPHRRWD